jgi:hypothetical protein
VGNQEEVINEENRIYRRYDRSRDTRRWRRIGNGAGRSQSPR